MEKEEYSGYEDGHYPFILFNRMVLRHETATEMLVYDFSFDYKNKQNDLIIWSQTGHASF